MNVFDSFALRHNCGIKLVIFQINLNKNSGIQANLELLNVRKKEARGRRKKFNNLMKKTHYFNNF